MFFKKNHPNHDSIKQILTNYTVDNRPLMDCVQHMQLDKDVLTLSLRLPDGLDVERIHAELGEQLHKQGIHQLDMNVALMGQSQTAQIHTPNRTTVSKSNKPLAQDTLDPHPRIRHIIAIASGKGGVGKSTTTVNLALALKQAGYQVGVLDADIYGPSIPDMLGVANQRPEVEAGKLVPLNAYGLPVMSIGSLIDSESTPIAWRGIKATGALMQLYQDTLFGHLDYLLIDMPPGTGDIALTLAQRIPITAAIIVTTPQHIALLDVKKGIELFAKTHIPVMGIVENMALHTCQNCGHTEAIFGQDGGEHIAKTYGVPLLGQLPLAQAIGEQVNQGVPSVVANGGVGDDFAVYYRRIADNVLERISQFAKHHDDRRIF